MFTPRTVNLNVNDVLPDSFEAAVLANRADLNPQDLALKAADLYLK